MFNSLLSGCVWRKEEKHTHTGAHKHEDDILKSTKRKHTASSTLAGIIGAYYFASSSVFLAPKKRTAEALYNAIIITITLKVSLFFLLFKDNKRSAKQFIETQIFMDFKRGERKFYVKNHWRCHFWIINEFDGVFVVVPFFFILHFVFVFIILKFFFCFRGENVVKQFRTFCKCHSITICSHSLERNGNFLLNIYLVFSSMNKWRSKQKERFIFFQFFIFSILYRIFLNFSKKIDSILWFRNRFVLFCIYFVVIYTKNQMI